MVSWYLWEAYSFLIRDRNGVNPERGVGGEKMRGIEGIETIIRYIVWEKNLLSIKEKEKYWKKELELQRSPWLIRVCLWRNLVLLSSFFSIQKNFYFSWHEAFYSWCSC